MTKETAEEKNWIHGKPAKDFPKDWIVIPVKDANEAMQKAREEEREKTAKEIFEELDRIGWFCPKEKYFSMTQSQFDELRKEFKSRFFRDGTGKLDIGSEESRLHDSKVHGMVPNIPSPPLSRKKEKDKELEK